MPVNSLDQLLAIEAIKQLKARYCRFVDTKQWDRLSGLFMPEARMDGFGSVGDGGTPVEFVAGISRRFARVISIHHVHNPEIELTGTGKARGIWAMTDYVEFLEGDGPAEAPGSRGFIGWGHYEEDYGLTPEGWKFAYLRLTRQRIDAIPHDHPRPMQGRYAHTPNWL
jgi:hypothetical protein